MLQPLSLLRRSARHRIKFCRVDLCRFVSVGKMLRAESFNASRGHLQDRGSGHRSARIGLYNHPPKECRPKSKAIKSQLVRSGRGWLACPMTLLGGGVISPDPPSDRFCVWRGFQFRGSQRKQSGQCWCKHRQVSSAPTMPCISTSGDRPMKNRTIAIIMAVAAFGGDFCLPASAQSSIGGVKKQAPLAAPVKPTSLGGPVKPTAPSAPIKPIALGGPAKLTSPVVPVSKPAPAIVASSPTSKCAAPCLARGPR